MTNELKTTGTRDGFALVDVIATALIVSVLFGLGLPALLNLRSASRETKCADRLKSIGVATIKFHDAQKRFPPGTLGLRKTPNFLNEYVNSSSEFSHVRCQNTSSFGQLMPFLDLKEEHAKVHKIMFDMDSLIDEKKGSQFASFLKADNVIATMELQPEAFTCPADEINKVEMPVAIEVHPAILESMELSPRVPLADGTGMAAHLIDVKKRLRDFDINGSKRWWQKGVSMFKSPLGRTNFLANCGAYSGGRLKNKELAQFEGPMSTRRKVAFKNVKDGTSNTVMYGETVGEIQEKKRIWSQGWFTAGLGRGRGNLGWKKGPDENTKSIFGDMEQAPGSGYGSAHKDVVNFVFVDGSNHAFVRDMDWKVAYAMFGMADQTQWKPDSKYERTVERSVKKK